MPSGCNSSRINEDRFSGSVPAQLPHPSLNGQSTQEFHGFHIADNSRAHIGNVYNNNTYSNVDKPDSAGERARDLMKALAFDDMSDRLFTVTPAHAETCSWFLETQDYMDWCDPACRHLHNGILWIKGKAGTGKSTLMRYIHDHAQHDSSSRTVIAFFFNGRSPNNLAKSTEGMYRSLLHQLYDNIPRLKKAAAQVLLVGSQSTWSLGRLEDLFRQAILGLLADEDVVCYIDALDECDTDEVRLSVECFETLSQVATSRGVSFLLCFSSRYYPHITMRAHVESKLDAAPQHLNDIECYLGNHLTFPSVLKLELKDEILERCSGIFLWVVLVTRMLKESFDAGMTRQYLHEQLNSLPRELHALFTSISQSADARFAVAMRWVLFAERPLEPQELYFAIRSAAGDLNSAYWDVAEISHDTIERYILHASRGLVERVPSEWPGDRRVQFVHESVREYLLSGSLAHLDCVSEQDVVAKSHEKMAEECQHYLKLCLHGEFTMLKFWQDHEIHDRPDPTRPNHYFVYPLVRYAANYVLAHVELMYLADPAAFGNPHFSLEDYVAVKQLLQDPDDRVVEYVPGHSAILLTVLIEGRDFPLAEYLLQSTDWPKGRTKNTTKRYTSRATGWTPSELDLSTCCGGKYGSPLQAAVAKGKFQLVQLLLSKGASPDPCWEESPNVAIRQYKSPLWLALEHTNKDMIQLLLENGAPVNRPEPSQGLRPLHAVFFMELTQTNFALADKVRLLLSYGADVNSLPCAGVSVGWKRSTAIHFAASRASRVAGEIATGVLRVLLEAHADVNAVDANDDTPLIHACRGWHLGAVFLLLRYGANAEYRSRTSGIAVEVAGTRQYKSLLCDLIRGRALRGQDGFLPLAPQLEMPNRHAPSRIPAPTRPHSRRAVRPLRYRRPPQSGSQFGDYVDSANLSDAYTSRDSSDEKDLPSAREDFAWFMKTEGSRSNVFNNFSPL